MYDTFVYNVTRFPGNVLMTTSPDIIDTKTERDAEVVKLYGEWGFKPAGQKRLGHLAADMIYLKNTATGYKMSQMRGTGRQGFKNEPVGDFVMDYLVAKGRWSL